MNRFVFRSFSALLLGLLLTTAACKKDTDPVAPEGGTPQGLAFVGPQWQMTAFLLDPSADFDGDGKVDADLLPFMEACDRDNTMMFHSNGQIMTSEGALRCPDESGSTGKPGTWQYDKASKTLKIVDGDNPADVSTWQVLDASAKTLKIKTTVVEDGQTFSATIHWKAV